MKGFRQFFKIYEDINHSKFTTIPEGASIPTSGVVKFGIDPTGPNLHLGHLVPILMVKKLGTNGLDIHCILGSYTAQLGDPSGKNGMRPILTLDQTKANADKILSQLHRVLGDDITVHYNHEWFNKMSMTEMLQILSKYTVQYLLSRDAFQKRMEASSGIGMHELIVPILQGLDSVQLNAAVEVGGTDQRFNFLLSRAVQEKSGQTPEICVMSPIINGTDGRKMSKTFNNCIYLNDSPKDVFQKAMSVTDEVMYQWYPLFTDSYDPENPQFKGKHPLELKKDLAIIITDIIWGPGEGIKQKAAHDSVSAGNLPTDIPEIEPSPIIDAIAAFNKSSRGDARKLILGGGVTIATDGKTLNKATVDTQLNSGNVLKIGKKNYVKVK